MELVIYPNPTSGMLTIKTRQINTSAQLTVVDLRGQIVYNDFVGNTTETIDLSGLQTGVYFVQINTGEQIVTKKVTISH